MICAGRGEVKDFPIAEFINEGACYAEIFAVLYSGGLVCHRCAIDDQLKLQRRPRGVRQRFGPAQGMIDSDELSF